MRLTDEEINNLKNKFYEFYPILGLVFKDGLIKARDFCENQKCYNCKISDDEKFPENHIWCNYLNNYFEKKFSCGKWEPRT